MKVLFVLSSPNSGSTLLSQLLGRHRSIGNLGEVTFLPKLLALNEPCTCGASLCECQAWEKVFRGLEARTGVHLPSDPYGLFLGDAIKDRHGSGQVDVEHQTSIRTAMAKLRGAFDSAMLLSGPRSLQRSCTLPSIRECLVNTHSLYEAAREAWDTPVLVDASKTLKKGPHLYLRYPDHVRLVHLVRDGRSVCVSRMKSMPLRIAARRWNHYNRLARRFLGRWVAPEHQRFIRHEDLVADPERHLEQLCSWLGTPFQSQMLTFDDLGPIHSAGGNPSRFRLDNGIVRVEPRWRTRLSKADLSQFERRAGTLNGELGYS